MPRKKNDRSDDLDIFGDDLADSFFSAGDDSGFWDDDAVEALDAGRSLRADEQAPDGAAQATPQPPSKATPKAPPPATARATLQPTPRATPQPTPRATPQRPPQPTPRATPQPTPIAPPQARESAPKAREPALPTPPLPPVPAPVADPALDWLAPAPTEDISGAADLATQDEVTEIAPSAPPSEVHPTIIPDLDPIAALVSDDDDDAVTADNFVDLPPDETLIFRRPMRPRPAPESPSVPEAPVVPEPPAPQAAPASDAAPSELNEDFFSAPAGAESGNTMSLFLSDPRVAEPTAPPAIPLPPAPEIPPLVPPRPPVLRDGVPSAKVRQSPRSPTQAPVGARQPYRPPTEPVERWRGVARVLEAEARAVTDIARRGALFAAAGAIARHQVGDDDEARRLFELALDNDHQDDALFRDYAALAGERGEFQQCRELLVRRAELLSGASAAEVYVDAALVARGALRDPAGALVLMEKALRVHSDDWLAMRELARGYRAAQRWPALENILDRMAGLTASEEAARLRVERGEILERHLERREEALACYRAAMRDAPEYTPGFLAAERLAMSLGDTSALQEVYRRAAANATGASKAFWLLRVARMTTTDAHATLAAWDEAVAELAADDAEIRRERQGVLRRLERWEALDAALSEEQDAATGTEAALVGLERADLLERRLDRPAVAVAALQAALRADPTAEPAVDGLARLLGRSGQHAELAELLEAHVAGLQDRARRVNVLFRLAEVYEERLDELARAQASHERILAIVPTYRPSLEALERIHGRRGQWAELVAIMEQRAALLDEPQAAAAVFHRAAEICRYRLHDAGRSRVLLHKALEAHACHAPALEDLSRLLEADGGWLELAGLLSRAADAATDTDEVVSLSYRAARLYADRVGQPSRAIDCLRQCLENFSGFLPAFSLLRELLVEAGGWTEIHELLRREADAAADPRRRHWKLLAAAAAAERCPDQQPADIARQILSENPRHGGAQRILEGWAVRGGDLRGLIEIYQVRAEATEDERERARLSARIADAASLSGDSLTTIQAVAEVMGNEADDRPLRALAAVAEGMGFWEEARRALEAAGDPGAREITRLIESHMGDPRTVEARWRQHLSESPDDPQALFGLERALEAAGSTDGLAGVHMELAGLAPSAQVAAVHRLLAGKLYSMADQVDAATTAYAQAYEAQPFQGRAFEALLEQHISVDDEPAVRGLVARLGPANEAELARALARMGRHAASAAAWAALLDREAAGGAWLASSLPSMLAREAALAAAEEWQELYDALALRAKVTGSADEVGAIKRQQRWILAEKLAETDRAWDYYQQLYADDPSDREVLEALARIASARGEPARALTYLRDLSATAVGDARVLCRYACRMAEVHLRIGDVANARSEYQRALELQPGDARAFEGLKKLAKESGDHLTLAGVLQREAEISRGGEQLARYRELARLWEEPLERSEDAIEAWKKVLELAPGDAEALRQLVSLTRSLGDWRRFTLYAEAMASRLEGAERTTILSEVGEVYLNQLYSEDDALRFLEEATAGAHPNLAAARHLEQFHAQRGAWERVVDAIVRQARASEGEAAVALLLKAAERGIDTLQDQEGAARIYAMVLERDPGNGAALRHLGEFLYKGGQLEQAIEIFSRMEDVEQARDLDDFYVQLEVALYYYRYAEALRRLGRVDDALGHYEQCLALNPSHLPSLESLGPILIRRERWEEGAKIYRHILRLTGGEGDPQRLSLTYTSLGTIEFNLGQLTKAKRWFQQALDQRSNDIPALQGIARVLFAQEDWSSLLNIYNIIIYHAQTPVEVVDAYLTKGFVLDARMGLPDKAAAHYEKSLAFDPAQAGVLLRLAELGLRRQEWPEAARLANQGLTLEVPRGEIRGSLLLVKAVAHASCGDMVAADESYRSAVEHDPELRTTLGAERSSPDVLHRHLTQRLQATL